MTVRDMRERMSNAEYTYWVMYHQKRQQSDELEQLKR